MIYSIYHNILHAWQGYSAWGMTHHQTLIALAVGDWFVLGLVGMWISARK